jgi:hypothetical protein
LGKKSPEVVAKEADAGKGILNFYVAFLLVFLVNAIFQVIATFLSAISAGGAALAFPGAIGAMVLAVIMAIVVPIVVIIFMVIWVALIHITAKILGGQGTYSQLLGTISMIDASIQGVLNLALTIIVGLLTIILSLLGPLGIVLILGVSMLAGIVGFIISIYGLFLNSKGVAAVHNFSTIKGFLSIIIPIIVITIILLLIVGLIIIIAGTAIFTAIKASTPNLSGMFGLPF